MIDPQELRIGNWVLYEGKHRFVQEIGKFGIDLYVDEDGEIRAEISFEELEPIEISKEILLRFGFEERAGVSYRKVVVSDKLNYVLEYVVKAGWTFQGTNLPKQPLALHELQNLYYHLIGEELEFA